MSPRKKSGLTAAVMERITQNCEGVAQPVIASHLENMEPDYFDFMFKMTEIPQHVRLAGEMQAQNHLVLTTIQQRAERFFHFTAVAVDVDGASAAINTTLSAMGFSLGKLRVCGFREDAEIERGWFVFDCELRRKKNQPDVADVSMLEDNLNHSLQGTFEKLGQNQFDEAINKAKDTRLDTAALISTDVDRSPLNLTGRVLGKDLMLEKQLARTRLSVVWLGRQQELDRLVAVKILPQSFLEESDQQDLARRFIQEAKTLAKLEHPNIVRIYEYGQGDDLYWMAMEYVSGGSLAGLISRKQRPQSLEAVKWLEQSLSALAYAHTPDPNQRKAAVIHRDIKPENLLLTPDGDVKLVDFGLLRPIGATVASTKTVGVVGTIYYMSPEQAGGRRVDERSDIYSLGATFFHLLSGSRPFEMKLEETETEFLAVLDRIKQGPSPSLQQANPNLPRALINIIQKMMAHDPLDRYQDATVALQEIQSYKKRGGFQEAASAEPGVATNNWGGRVPPDERKAT